MNRNEKILSSALSSVVVIGLIALYVLVFNAPRFKNDTFLIGVNAPFEITQSGTADNPLVYAGGIIDGANTTQGDCLLIRGSWVIVRDMEVRNCYNFGIRTTGDNITIENVNVHNNIRQYWDGAKCNPTGGWGAGIRVGPGSDNVTIQDSTVSQNCGEGIGILAAANSVLLRNTAKDNYSVNLAYIDETSDTQVFDSVSICTDPRYYRSGLPARGLSFGIEGYGTTKKVERAIIQRNVVIGCRGVNLYLQSGGQMVDSNISYNQFDAKYPAVTFGANTTVNTIVSNNVGSGFSGATLIANMTPTKAGAVTATSVTVTKTPTLTVTPTLTPTATFTPVLTSTAEAVPTEECYLIETSKGQIEVCIK